MPTTQSTRRHTDSSHSKEPTKMSFCKRCGELYIVNQGEICPICAKELSKPLPEGGSFKINRKNIC